MSAWATPSLLDPKYAAIARDGAKYLKKNGWTVGFLIKPDGRACAVGACLHGSARDRLFIRAMARFSGWLGLAGTCSTVYQWNDDRLSSEQLAVVRILPPTNKNQVIAALLQFANEIDPPKDK